ncbi:MAG: SUMF1/EgtB/PvdO family nonheme iron enzyme [Planctomycetales bacterium]|nr:SUMF1/EgtB/PvdO family nonheme iron enzyme [Planctomycetales bacterium]
MTSRLLVARCHSPAEAIVCLLMFGALWVGGGAAPAAAAEQVDFARQIQPLLSSACLRCHNEQNAEGGLRLDSREALLKGGERGPAVVLGKASDSRLVQFVKLTPDADEFMPPAEAPLDSALVALLSQWIDEGAAWPAGIEMKPQPRIHFGRHIQPLLEMNCVGCHSKREKHDPDGGLDLTTRELAMSSEALIPFDAGKSRLFEVTTLAADAEEVMPPKSAGGPLKQAEVEKLRAWIEQGALWPKDVTLKQRPKIQEWDRTPDTIELLEKIHKQIVEKSNGDAAAMADYSSKVPRTGAAYHMVALKGGEFLMGSPPDEAKREENEGPQAKVTVSPFWMGKFEVTWDEYEPFMITAVDRAKHGGRTDFDPKQHDIVDAVSQPTPPYTEMSFGMGQFGYPAISMTQHAANKYCQWLSAQTGHFYRLPTEAEWEYACRAGTTTAYSFGDDPAKLDDFAWHKKNSGMKYQKIGTRKPNPWGLHDMHGNVMEWTTDAFLPDYFAKLEQKLNPNFRPQTLYPRSVRGGSWFDPPNQLRSAYRRGSDPSWKFTDPQLPKSIWYHTDAQWIGFRIVRPLKVPTVEELDYYWNSAVNKF